MGRVVTFPQTLNATGADGVTTAPITVGETQEMEAEIVRVAPGKQWISTVPRGSDCYLFALNGTAQISSAGARHALTAQTFAAIEEGGDFAVENDGKTAIDLVKVVAPPRPTNGHAGFRGPIHVAARAAAPTADVPAEKKKRIYFVDPAAAHSERGHAMIVEYGKDTRTVLHHHPNAESLFVVLDGAIEFTVNGAGVVVKPGAAAYFGCNDPHGLHVADGFTNASFLEFHIPAAYTTVKHG